MTNYDEFDTAIDAAIQPLLDLECELRRLSHYEDSRAQVASENIWQAVRLLQSAQVALEGKYADTERNPNRIPPTEPTSGK